MLKSARASSAIDASWDYQNHGKAPINSIGPMRGVRGAQGPNISAAVALLDCRHAAALQFNGIEVKVIYRADPYAVLEIPDLAHPCGMPHDEL